MTYPVHDFDFWSPVMGCDATRISIAHPAHGREYFAIIPREDGMAFSRLRRKAIERITEAIERNLEPGEVRWSA